MMVEAIGQSAWVLFSKTDGTKARPGEFLALGFIDGHCCPGKDWPPRPKLLIPKFLASIDAGNDLNSI